MIVPTGSASWLHTNAHDTYGGNVDKKNSQGLGVVNPDTDVGAEQYVRLCEDVAAVQRTSVSITIGFTCNDTGVTDPTVTMVRTPTRVYSVSYSGGTPPTGLPTVTRISDGVVQIDLPDMTDDYGITGPLHVVGGIGQLHGSAPGVVNPVPSDSNADNYNDRVTVTIQDAAAVIQDATVSLDLYT